MASSILEGRARAIVGRFLASYISTGCLIFLEGDKTYCFKGSNKKCSTTSILRIHSPQFYWKVMTRESMGLADAYIDGDFSFDDKDEGLLNLFMVLIANREAKTIASKGNKKRFRGWWTPLLLTSTISSATYFFQHLLRRNSLTQARRNISRHYDLSNEYFALFLGESMAYSCAIFKKEDEDLKTAQMRKFSVLIQKARINKNHEVLEIGSGWGTFAIELVKQTGCRYCGITISEEQLKFAEMKVKEAGLQDHIKFMLCDYRELLEDHKYDRIISCEMIEHVGHEYLEVFFGQCESLLAEDGLLVLQFSSYVDERYDEYRRSSEFLREYIFPGICVPSMSRITSAMVAASRFCVEHAENIGSNLYPTFRYWRKNLLENKSKILDMGFDEKFIRTWEYYFDYCAAGFKSYTLLNYQMVFSLPGNIDTLGYPYKGFPSAFGSIPLEGDNNNVMDKANISALVLQQSEDAKNES